MKLILTLLLLPRPLDRLSTIDPTDLLILILLFYNF